MDAQRAALDRAAGPEGIARERHKAAGRRETLEGRAAGTAALVELMQHDVKTEEQMLSETRAVGEAHRQRMLREDPFLAIAERTYIGRGEAWHQERMAKELWVEQLTDDERAAIHAEHEAAWTTEHGSVRHHWRQMPIEQRHQALMGAAMRDSTVIYDYSTHLHRSEGTASPRVAP